MSPIFKTHRQVVAFLVELSFYTQDAPLRLADAVSLKGRCMSYREFLAADLKAVGWISARKGAGGGYFLAVKPDEIMLRAVDEFVCRNRSDEKVEACQFLQAADQALNIFPRKTIHEIAKQVGGFHAHG